MHYIPVTVECIMGKWDCLLQKSELNSFKQFFSELEQNMFWT